MGRNYILLCVLLVGSITSAFSVPVFGTSCQASKTFGREYVQNPGFENGRSPWWQHDLEGWERIYMNDEYPGACGSWAAKISTHAERRGCSRNAGIFQFISINQSVANPLIVSGWSAGKNLTGKSDSNYALYADITFANGEQSFAHIVPFDIVEGWQFKTMVIDESLPIQSMYLFALFRNNHTGFVYFDALSVREDVSSDSGVSSDSDINLIENPMFQRKTADCKDVIDGWEAVAGGRPYSTCAPATGVEFPTGDFVATPGNDGRSGVEQLVQLGQITPMNLTLSVWCTTTMQTPHAGIVKERAMKMVVTYADGTQETKSVDVGAVGSGFRRNVLSFAPSRPVENVLVQFVYQGQNGAGTVYWNQASLVQS